MTYFLTSSHIRILHLKTSMEIMGHCTFTFLTWQQSSWAHLLCYRFISLKCYVQRLRAAVYIRRTICPYRRCRSYCFWRNSDCCSKWLSVTCRIMSVLSKGPRAKCLFVIIVQRLQRSCETSDSVRIKLMNKVVLWAAENLGAISGSFVPLNLNWPCSTVESARFLPSNHEGWQCFSHQKSGKHNFAYVETCSLKWGHANKSLCFFKGE